MHDEKREPTRPLPGEHLRLVTPWIVAVAWTAVGAWLLFTRPPADGTNFIARWPDFGSSWLPPLVAGALFLTGVAGLLMGGRLGWLLALTVATLGAAVHPYQLVLSLPLIPYLFTSRVRVAYRVGEPPRMMGWTSTALGLLTGMALVLLFGFHFVAAHGMFGALQRGKSKRTLGDMRTIATAVETYQIDHQAFPAHVGEVEGLRALLEPTYATKLPSLDGWRKPFWYVSRPGAEPGYRIESFGRDGVPSGPRQGPITSFDEDVIFADGAFVTYPDGTIR